MKKALTFKIAAISAILITVLVAIPLVGCARAQGETSYSFTLMGPNVSEAEYTIQGTHVKDGDLLCIRGAGTFDTLTGAVSGGGAFTHINFDGTVHGRGIWTVTEFVSFDGELLIINIHAISTSEDAEFNLRLKISAEGVTVWGGPGYVVALFGIIVSGRTLFHPHG
nr:hypothetical protein [Candidatus Njordarchaeum guaymaensis]